MLGTSAHRSSTGIKSSTHGSTRMHQIIDLMQHMVQIEAPMRERLARVFSAIFQRLK
jgi:hypothetical protein